jgi:hypothetical protein
VRPLPLRNLSPATGSPEHTPGIRDKSFFSHSSLLFVSFTSNSHCSKSAGWMFTQKLVHFHFSYRFVPVDFLSHPLWEKICSQTGMTLRQISFHSDVSHPSSSHVRQPSQQGHFINPPRAYSPKCRMVTWARQNSWRIWGWKYSEGLRMQPQKV